MLSLLLLVNGLALRSYIISRCISPISLLNQEAHAFTFYGQKSTGDQVQLFLQRPEVGQWGISQETITKHLQNSRP